MTKSEMDAIEGRVRTASGPGFTAARGSDIVELVWEVRALQAEVRLRDEDLQQARADQRALAAELDRLRADNGWLEGEVERLERLLEATRRQWEERSG